MCVARRVDRVVRVCEISGSDLDDIRDVGVRFPEGPDVDVSRQN